MTRILAVWEDDYWEPLDRVLKRLVRLAAPAPDAEVPAVLGHTTRSNGAFGRYARITWPAVRSRGMPANAGAIDHLVCIVDGDRLHDLLPAQIPGPPADATAVPAWHANAERAWQEHLRSHCDPGGPPETTVHGVVLRWAKESLLLAGYDQPAMEAHLGITADRPEVSTALSRCAPSQPQRVDDASFTDTFHRPSTCLDILRKACGQSALHKSAPEIDDALRALGRDSLPTLRARVPELARVAALVWRLHLGAPEVPSPARNAGPKPRNKPRARKG